jgi:GT2 family glycosyltransferase
MVVPTLGDRLDYLDLSLKSILNQAGARPLVVVVALDPSGELRTLCAQYPRVVLQPQHGQGISSAINQGWQTHGAAAPYWAWLGDDDLLAPGSLRRTVTVLKADESVSAVYGKCVYIDAHGVAQFVLRPTALAPLVAAYGPNGIPQQGSVFRASSVERVGLLDESLKYSMDLDLFLRLRRDGRLHYVPEVVAAFRWHKDSTTVSNRLASNQEADVVRRRLQPRFAALARPWGIVGSGVGRSMRARSRGVDTNQWGASSGVRGT